MLAFIAGVAAAFAICAIVVVFANPRSNEPRSETAQKPAPTLLEIADAIEKMQRARIRSPPSTPPIRTATDGTLSRHFTTRDGDCSLAQYRVVEGAAGRLFSKTPKTSKRVRPCLPGETMSVIGAGSDREEISCLASSKKRVFRASEFAVGTTLLPCLRDTPSHALHTLPWG